MTIPQRQSKVRATQNDSLMGVTIMTKLTTERPTELRRRMFHRPRRLDVAIGVSLIAVAVLSGCGDDDSTGDNSTAFCNAIERADNANPFGAEAREPDLDLFLAGLEGLSAAYTDALANAPSEIKDDFEVFASEATQRYTTALEIADPTDQSVDAVIFGATEGGLTNEGEDELLAQISTECGIDL
jgi:hypothetical protein